MLFGLGRAIEVGHLAMAHNTGYTAERLGRVALAGSFSEVRIVEGGNFDLWAILLAPAARTAEIAPMFTGTNVSALFDQADWVSDVRKLAGAR